MKKSAELKQKRAQKIEAQKTLHAKAEGEKRGLNETETGEFRSLQTDIETLTGELNDALAYEENLRSLEGSEEPGLNDENKPEERKEVFSIHRAIRSQMVNGGVKLEGAELDMHTRASASAQAVNIPVSGVAIELRAMQTVTGDSGAKGGNLVPTELQSPINFLRPEPLMKKIGATYIAGLTGNLRFPKNEGGIVASWEGETTTTPETANTYGYLDSIPKRLSVTVPISLQNLMQSSIDLEMYTINEMKLAIENAIDAASVNGSGTGQPLGILNNPNVNAISTAANGSAPSWDMVVDSETAVFVANASAAKMSYVVNPQTRGKFKKTKHDAGDLNYIMGTDGTVNGFPAATSNHVPANLTKGTGTNLSALLFGDFSQLNIHEWNFMDLSVDEFSRKKEGLIEVTINIFLDVLIKQPKAFSVVKGIITT
ncbi:phage major capsid protein [Flavobacterium sp. FlaQc-28]|uniref:phage major capsid protein n=1 Tax=Flavobacterium sp. FlaQc-28 TaxID=3374178 RepID=UPI0037578E07